MQYLENQYWGMNFVWWTLWFIMLFWIFVIPYDIPYQRHRKDSPLDLLKRRLATGEINLTEFNDHKKVLKSE
jgi:putative membrane protein